MRADGGRGGGVGPQPMSKAVHITLHEVSPLKRKSALNAKVRVLLSGPSVH